MDQESLRALDDVNVGDEVLVRLEQAVLIRENDMRACMGVFEKLIDNHVFVKGARARYAIPVDDIVQFRIRRRAEVKHGS